MDFVPIYTAEQEAIRAEVRAWLEENMPEGINDPKLDAETRYWKKREIGKRLGQRGWLYPLSPKQYGGGGLTIDHALILAEEMDRYDLQLPPYYTTGGTIGAVCIEVWGTEEQKRHFLPPLFTGEVRAWQLLTEPDTGGSDLAGTSMAATRDGDEYVLNGQKVFVGSDYGTEWMWTIVRTDPNLPRHQNLSWLMVDASAPGITIQQMELLSDSEEGHKNIVFFDNVRVPAFALIGGENNGWRVASTHLELEHGGTGGLGLSVATRDRVWEQLLPHAQEHNRHGQPLSQDRDVRDQLAEIYARSQVAKLFRLRNFWASHLRLPRSYEGSQSSYVGKMTGLWSTLAIHSALGPASLTRDATWGAEFLEGQQRRGITMVHPGGTADIQRVVMARRIGIGRTEREQVGALPD